jgi:hypothetical protein
MLSGCGAITLEHPQFGKKILLVNPEHMTGFKCKRLKQIQINPRGSIIAKNKSMFILDYFGLVKTTL